MARAAAHSALQIAIAQYSRNFRAPIKHSAPMPKGGKLSTCSPFREGANPRLPAVLQ